MKKIPVTYLPFVVAVLACLTPWITSPIALVIGFMLSALGWTPKEFSTAKLTKKLLACSIVGLGFGISFQEALTVTGDGFALIVVTILGTLFIGTLVAHKIGLNQQEGFLISAGTSICGGSAIAAVSPVIKASDEQIGLALAVVFILNSVALFIFPLIGHALHLDQHTFGTWAAIAIHDTSSVVGAASAYGEEALKTATTLKLARALWIVPVTLISALLFKNKGHKFTIPFFILFYCVAILISDYFPQFNMVYSTIFMVAKQTLVVCLFLIGSSISITTLQVAGVKPLLFGVFLWLVISVLSLLWLIFL